MIEGLLLSRSSAHPSVLFRSLPFSLSFLFKRCFDQRLRLMLMNIFWRLLSESNTKRHTGANWMEKNKTAFSTFSKTRMLHLLVPAQKVCGGGGFSSLALACLHAEEVGSILIAKLSNSWVERASCRNRNLIFRFEVQIKKGDGYPMEEQKENLPLIQKRERERWRESELKREAKWMECVKKSVKKTPQESGRFN